MKLPPLTDFLLAFAGGLAVAGFAPYGFWLATLLSLLVLLLVWRKTHSPLRAFEQGFLWGMGYFVSGVSWLEISLTHFGGMPYALALVAIVLFSAVLALFPALVGYLLHRPRTLSFRWRYLALFPALWVMSEWVRSWLFTGFPWLTVGYSQVPRGPFAGFAPVLGILGVSLAIAYAAALLLCLVSARREQPSRKPVTLTLALMVVAGLGLNHWRWTYPVGEPLSVALMQGNVPQDRKFAEGELWPTLQRYLAMVEQGHARLTVLPESALPVTRQELSPLFVESLSLMAAARHGDVLAGVFDEPVRGQYYNSVFSFGSSAPQVYHKRHLVPFGEVIPLPGLLAPVIHSALKIPLDSQQAGDPHPKPLEVAGQKVAVGICYEDAFGDETLAGLPQATLLANLTNDAWFGDSIGPEQHLQMAQARALETGRPMLRATNTGVTALIDQRGRVINRAPRQRIFMLTGTVRGFQGITPYVRWGNAPVLLIALTLILLALRKTRQPS
jgi:apolipoprotein N-acyltransferase